MHTYNRIGRPWEAHAVRTPEAYLEKLHEVISNGRRQAPGYAWKTELADSALVSPFIAAGRWVVLCPCGNAPSYDPEWQMALCFDPHGSMYLNVAPPEGWERAERLLMRRPFMQHRNWVPMRESVEDLAEENRANGIIGE